MIYAALILSCPLSGCEVWELKAVDLQKVEALHSRRLCVLLRVPFAQNRTNSSTSMFALLLGTAVCAG